MDKNFYNKGFTLVEIIVAVALFTVVATISSGALISIFNANNKSQTSKIVVDNLNIAIEDMARTIRFGSSYHCGGDENLDETENCPNGDDLMAVNFEGNTVAYALCGNSISKSSDAGDEVECNDMEPITSPDAVIQHLRFYTFGSDNPDQLQPYVVIVIKGYVGNKPTSQTNFSIQTTVSQRALDI